MNRGQSQDLERRGRYKYKKGGDGNNLAGERSRPVSSARREIGDLYEDKDWEDKAGKKY